MKLLLESKEVWKAHQLAAAAHKGQTDKGGSPYINHPIAVAEALETEEEQVVALLHDVVEDTPITLEELLKQGFSQRVVQAVDCLTHREGEPREAYLARIKSDSLATAVKLSDLRHNSDLGRIPIPTEKDFARVEKYKREMEYLKNPCSCIPGNGFTK